MFSEERKKKIMEMLEDIDRVDVAELSSNFKVSESTIRRDLKELENSNLLKRTHGGAVSNKIVAKQAVKFEPDFMEKEVRKQNEKRAIAKKAVEFIQNGDTILLDSGTTTFYLLQEIKAFSKLTVVTNALISPAQLDQHSGIEIILLGGSLRRHTQALIGSFTEHCLNLIRVDKCFIATNGVDLRMGLTTPDMAEADIKRKMIECAKEVILLTDSSKFGKTSFSKFANLEQIDVCITDSGINGEYFKNLINRGINVVTTEPDKEGKSI